MSGLESINRSPLSEKKDCLHFSSCNYVNDPSCPLECGGFSTKLKKTCKKCSYEKEPKFRKYSYEGEPICEQCIFNPYLEDAFKPKDKE